MPPVCPNGSEPNNLSLGKVWIDGAYMNSIMPGGIQWYNSYFWLVPGFEIDVPAFCSVDPPSYPAPDAVDWGFMLLGPTSSLAQASIRKIQLWIQNWAWYQMCHCKVTATPAPPAAPPAPVNLPPVLPPLSAPSAYPCDTFVSAQQPVPASTFVNQVARRLPPGAQTIAVTQKNIVNGVTPGGMQWAYAFFDANGNSLMGAPLLAPLASGATRTDVLNVPVNAAIVNLSVTAGAVSQTNLAETDSAVFCVALPPTTVVPPDPQSTGLLRQILSLVTILQRQLVPFAYIVSTAHAGLSGAGSFAVQGLLGVRITLTTIPPTLRQDTSFPAFIFNGGWVSVLDANGFIDETRAHSQNMTWMPRIMSDATVIGYSFAPGVVATITELQREP